MQFPVEHLGQLALGDSTSLNRLVVYPIIQSPVGESQLKEIDEAIEIGWIEVTEVSKSGVVPEVEISNQSDHPVIIFNGEELVGAKQNRIANVTMIVTARESMNIPVSCVEQGRWDWSSRCFVSGDFLYPSLRNQILRKVTENVCAGRGYIADQRMIWDDIASKQMRMGVRSETGAMKDLSDRYRVGTESLRLRIPHLPKQVGYLAFIGNGFAGGDVFPCPEICGRKLAKLVSSYHLDSLDASVDFPLVTARKVLEQVIASKVEPFNGAGAGKEIRFESSLVHGTMTTFGKNLAHLAIFPRCDLENTRRAATRAS